MKKNLLILFSTSVLVAGSTLTMPQYSYGAEETLSNEAIANTEYVVDGSGTETYSFENGDELVVETSSSSVKSTYYVNGEESVISTLDKDSNIVTEEHADGTVKEIDAADVMKEVSESYTEVEDEISTQSYGTQIDSKYSDGWGEWGYLYSQQETTYGTGYELQFGAGTAIATITSVIGAFITGGTSAILFALGTSITGVSIDTAVHGEVRIRDRKTTLSVTSQGQLGLQEERGTRDTEVVDIENGGTTFENPTNYGSDRSNGELLDIGIYNVVLENL